MGTGRKLVGLVGAAILLASCGGGGDKKATSTSPPSTQFPTFNPANKIDPAAGTPGAPAVTSPVPSTGAGGGPVIAPPPTTGVGGAAAPAGPVTDSNVRYKVAAGDTLNSIAKKLGVSVEDLMALNGITNANQVAVGRALKVPLPRASSSTTKAGNTTATTKPASTGGTGGVTITGEKVTVGSGDTMVKIAARLGVSVSDLIAANPSVDPAHMPIGTKLNVPAKSGSSSPTTKSGTTTTTTKP